MTLQPLTKNIDMQRPPLNLTQYRAAGGYAGVEKMYRDMAPADASTPETVTSFALLS